MTNNTKVSWEIVDSIGVLTIDGRPENCIVDPEFVNLVQLKRWSSDSSLRGIVICGAGRHFSSGADLDCLKSLAKSSSELSARMEQGGELLSYIQSIPLPVVAAISGACFGAGLEIALACHIRICNKNAVFAFPESTLGIIPGLGGCTRLIKNADIATSLQMLLSGDLVDASAAQTAGFIDLVVEEKQVKTFAIEYLKKMVANRSSEVIRAIVQAVNNARSLPMDEALRKETQMFCELAIKRYCSLSEYDKKNV